MQNEPVQVKSSIKPKLERLTISSPLCHSSRSTLDTSSNRFVCKLALLLLFLITSILLQAQAGTSPKQTEKWQRERQKKIKEKYYVENQKSLIVEKEQSVLQRLQQLESELIASKKALTRNQRELADNRLKVEELQVEQEELHHRYEGYKKLVAKRIRAIYKVGYNGRYRHTLKMILGTQNLVDLLRKYKYLGFIVEEDQRLVTLLQTQQEEMRQTRIELDQRIKTIEEISKEVQAQRNVVSKQQQKHQQLLDQYVTEREENSHRLEQIKTEIAAYNDHLGFMAEERFAEKAQEAQGIHKDLIGQLPWPVAGKVVPNQTKFDKGVTVQAENEVPVHSVAEGIVAKTIPSIVGYGNTVLIVHGSGYISVYAHLSKILVRESEFVEAEQVIGEVGDTGSLNGAALYFELWHNYDHLNTHQWLSARAPTE